MVGLKITQITVKKIKDKIKKNKYKGDRRDTPALLFVLGIEKQVHDTPKCFSMFR